MNKETLTKAKIKRAVSTNLKGITSIKFYSRLSVSSSEMPASFYPRSFFCNIVPIYFNINQQ